MFLIFDTETTGKANFDLPPEHPSQPRLVQLGAILLNHQFRTCAEINLIVRPEDGVVYEPGAVEKHKITREHALAYGLPERDVLTMFTHLCDKADTLVAHNIRFDGIVMGRAYDACGLTVTLPDEKRCTMIEMTKVCKLPGGRNGEYKWPTLEQAYGHVTNGRHLEGAHDAMVDVRACATIFRWLMGDSPVVEAPAEAAPSNASNLIKPVKKQPYTEDTLMPFGKWRGKRLGSVNPGWFRWYLEQDNPSDKELWEYAKARF